MRVTAPRPLWFALPLLFLATASGTAHAQTIADMERRLLPYRLGTLDTLPARFWESLAYLRGEEARQGALKAEILFGLSGDEAGERSLYKLNTGISLSRGDFPSELSVDSRLGLQLRDGVLQEDVTSLRITYDYHATNRLQYFAFAERFTDSFLSIQQRYEIGFGVRLAANIGYSGRRDSLDNRLGAVRSVFAPIRLDAEAGRSTPASLTDATIDRFSQAVANVEQALHDSDARLLIGVAASVFAEIERADLDVVSVPSMGPVAGDSIKSKNSLASEQRYRLSIRPTFRWRPRRDVSIMIFPYFKLPLDLPRRVPDGSGRNRLDYRRDIYSELTWSLRGNDTGLENVEFVIRANHYYDNVPPSLSAAVIAAELAKGRMFTNTEAQGSHRMVSLALRVRW